MDASLTNIVKYLANQDARNQWLMTDRQDLVNIQLKIHKSFKSYPGDPSDYSVVLLGPVAEQRRLDTEKPLRCMPSVFDTWIKDIWVPKNAAIFFRFGVMRPETSENIEQECIEARRTFIGLTPVIIECEYNEKEMAIVQVHDRLVGGPTYNNLTKIPDLPQLPETLSDVRFQTDDTSVVVIQNRTECSPNTGNAPSGCPTEMYDAPLPAVNSFLRHLMRRGGGFSTE